MEKVTEDNWHVKGGNRRPTSLKSDYLKDNGFAVFELTSQLYCISIYQNHVEITNEQQISHVCENLISHTPANAHIIVTINLEEQNIYDNLMPWYIEFNYQLRKLKDSNKILNFTIITNSSINDSVELHTINIVKPLPNLMSVHWFLCTYSMLYTQQFEWVSNTGRVLYLPGKLDKVHRIGPLYDILTNNNYKNNSRYAYTADQSFRDEKHLIDGEASRKEAYDKLLNLVHSYCESNSITYDQLVDLLETNEADLDGLQQLSRLCLSLGMWPVQEEVYKSTSVELVSETHFPSGPAHITEKTFRPMLAGQPFIHTSSMITVYLQHLGFETFRTLTGDQWVTHGYLNITFKEYSNDPEIHLPDLKQNVKAAFALADLCAKNNDVKRQAQNIINNNRKKCVEIVNSYQQTLNRRHDNIFTDDVFAKLTAVAGIY